MVLPARLGHSGDVPLVRGLAQADPAEAELAVVGARASTAATTVVAAGFELWFAALSDLLRSLSHPLNSSPRRPHSGRPDRQNPRNRPRPPRLRAWRRPPGSPLSAVPARPARSRPFRGPPLCAAPLLPRLSPLPAPPGRDAPPERRACPAP